MKKKLKNVLILTIPMLIFVSIIFGCTPLVEREIKKCGGPQDTALIFVALLFLLYSTILLIIDKKINKK